jgi:hypothetical protein
MTPLMPRFYYQNQILNYKVKYINYSDIKLVLIYMGQNDQVLSIILHIQNGKI